MYSLDISAGIIASLAFCGVTVVTVDPGDYPENYFGTGYLLYVKNT